MGLLSEATSDLRASAPRGRSWRVKYLPEKIEIEDKTEKEKAAEWTEKQRAHAAAATVEKAVAEQKAQREQRSGRKDPNQPVSFARACFESVYHETKQPWAWDHLIPEGDIPRGYENPIPWIGVVQPSNWHEKVQDTDEESGEPMFDKNGEMILTWANPLRIRHPNAIFYSNRRLQLYRDVIFTSGSSKYCALWSIHISGQRWISAEPIIKENQEWWAHYATHFDIQPVTGLNIDNAATLMNPDSASAEV